MVRDLVLNSLCSLVHAWILVWRSDSSAWWETFFSQQHSLEITENTPHCIGEIGGISWYLSINLIFNHSTALVQVHIFGSLRMFTALLEALVIDSRGFKCQMFRVWCCGRGLWGVKPVCFLYSRAQNWTEIKLLLNPSLVVNVLMGALFLQQPG